MESHQALSAGLLAPYSAPPRPVARPRAIFGLLLLLLVISLFLVLPGPAYAVDGALDPSFVSNPGVQWLPEIRGQVYYNTGGPYNGYSLLFGSFYGINLGSGTQDYHSLARLKGDGSLDTSFIFNFNIGDEIRSVYIYPHNDPLYADYILIGGNFGISTPSGNYRRVARLQPNGSLDTNFPQTFRGEGGVNAIGVIGSGDSAKILVGGYCLRTGSEDTPGPFSHLVRLNYDGNLDTGYTPWSAPNGYISDIRVSDPLFPNNVLIFCSYPKNPDGSGGTYYALLFDYNVNLSSPVTFIGDEKVDGPIFNMAKQSDGKYVLCGQFQNVYNSGSSSWVPRNRVARFSSSMVLDTGYNVGAGPDGPVTQISPMSTADDRMVLAGDFSNWNGAACGYLVRLTNTGAVDSGFTTGARADDRILKLNWFSNGSGGLIYGYFRSYNGTSRGCIAGLNGDGSLNGGYGNITVYNGGCGSVRTMAAQSDGKIIIGGGFSGVGGKYRGNLARVNPNGSLDTSFKGAVDGCLQSVALQADGKILVAGCYGQCQGYASNSLARLNPDGSLDTTFKANLGAGFDNSWEVNQVVPLSNGQLMAAGDIKKTPSYSQVPAVRLNSNGSRDIGFDASGFSISDGVWWAGQRLAVVGNNYYLIAGPYDTATTMNGGGYLARFNSTNGSLDTSFAPTAPVANIATTDGGIYDMFLQPDGKIVVGGGFTQVKEGSAARRALARFSANGSPDATFNPSINLPFGATSIIIDAMARQPNGKILFEANSFNSTYNYVSTQVARLNADGSPDSTFATGNPTNGYHFPGDNPESILRLPSGKALIGGIFGSYNGTTAFSLVRVFAGPPNFNPAEALLLLLD